MRSIIYPIFLSCRDCTTDVYWKRIFENLSYGDTPKGIYFKDETIYSITKKKEFNYSFKEKEPENIHSDIYHLFHNVYGIKSSGDLCKKRELFEEFQKNNSNRRSEELWNKIKRKSLRDNLIQDYTINCSKKYNLSMEDTKILYFFLSIGCTFKLFNGNDITLRDGFIESIEGIDFSYQKVKVLRKFEEPIIKKEYSGKEIYLYSLWETYLKTLS